jgi:hypothetical protein
MLKLIRFIIFIHFFRGLISEESGKGNFDERRILMLKCQVYQMEKQVNFVRHF